MCSPASFPDFSDLSEQEREQLLEKARLETRLSAIRHWERAANTSVVDLADMVLAWWKDTPFRYSPFGRGSDETPKCLRLAAHIVAYAFLSHYDGDDMAQALSRRLEPLCDSFEVKYALEQWQAYQEALEAIKC